MSYTSHFAHADDVIDHLDQVVIPGIQSPLLEVKYIGFATIAAVTVYELAIRHILVEFATKKHTVFGNYKSYQLEKIKGRIRLLHIRNDYIKSCGQKYLRRFDRKISAADSHSLSVNGRSITTSYSNLITWRHSFVHQANIQSPATFQETMRAYRDGKQLISILYETMQR